MNFWVKCSEQTKAFTNTMMMRAGNPGLELKRFPTCKTCDKWGEMTCPCSHTVYYGDVPHDIKDTAPDFFCAGHQDFQESK
jgi:hypothetical protein